MMAATFPLPALAKLLSCFMAEKLLVNDLVFNFGVVAAEAGESVNPVTTRADTAARLAILLIFPMCILPTPTFLCTATRRVDDRGVRSPHVGDPSDPTGEYVD